MASPLDGLGGGRPPRRPYAGGGTRPSRILGLSQGEDSKVMSFLPPLLDSMLTNSTGGAAGESVLGADEELVPEGLLSEISLATGSSAQEESQFPPAPLTIEAESSQAEHEWSLVSEESTQGANTCPVCGYREQRSASSIPRVSLYPEQWSVCRRCYSFRRASEVTVTSSTAQGWVVPVGLLTPSFGRQLLSPRRGMFVDCSPYGFMKTHCKQLFDRSMTIGELEHNDSIKSDSITCYSCLETTGNTDWVLETLLSHLDPDGILRVNWLLPPFASRPLAGVGWLEEKGVDLRYLPSRMGAQALLDRLGLRVLQRSRTINVPIACGNQKPQPSGVLNALRSRLQLVRTVFDSAINAGFGEELVLIRDSAKPPGEFREHSWRSNGKDL